MQRARLRAALAQALSESQGDPAEVERLTREAQALSTRQEEVDPALRRRLAALERRVARAPRPP